jgi:hypothetical protein
MKLSSSHPCPASWQLHQLLLSELQQYHSLIYFCTIAKWQDGGSRVLSHYLRDKSWDSRLAPRHRLQDFEFQNYAMHRLTHAVLCQSGAINPLTFRFVRAQSVRGSKLNWFLERMLFMNWGDEQRVIRV